MDRRRWAYLIRETIAISIVIALLRAAVLRWLTVGLLPPIAPIMGVALSFTIWKGPRVTFAILIGGVAGTLLAGGSVLAAATVGASLPLQSLIAYAVLQRWKGFRREMDSTHSVVGLGVAALTTGLVITAVGVPLVFSQGLIERADIVPTVAFLMVSQVLGVFMVTPPFLVLLARGGWPRVELTARRAEVALVASLSLLIGLLMFLTPVGGDMQPRLFAFIVLPLLIWVALRGSDFIALSLPGILLVIATVGAIHGVGMYGQMRFPRASRNIQTVGMVMSLFGTLLVANESSHRRALREVSEREARLQRVLSGSNDGFWDWDARTDRLDMSERLCEIIGVPYAERPRLRNDYLMRVHPDDWAVVQRAMTEHFAGHAPSYTGEYRVRHGIGHWVWVLSRGRAIERDAAGAPVRVSGTVADISARKQAEQALKASEELFASFMRFSPAAAFINDANGRLLYANEAYRSTIWGDHEPDWRGRTKAELFPPETARLFALSDHTVLYEERTVVVEQEFQGASGPVTWLAVKFPLRDPYGERLVGGMALDISDRHRAEERRRALDARATEAQKLESLGLLAGGVAHDFNNILTSILGYADLARDQVPAHSAVQQSLDQIVVGARNAAELTRQMLAYAGRSGVAMQPLVLTDLVREMGHLLQVSIPKRVRLNFELEPALSATDGDEAQLRQVVMNLILNASEAIGEQAGMITLVTRTIRFGEGELVSRWAGEELAAGDYVEFAVTDTGCGMSPETVARVFDPFFSTKFTGRGLGLAAVLGIVRAHRGTVQVESTVGEGTTFRVLLPASRKPLGQPAGDAVADPWRASGTALVVDDEESVRRLAATMLGRIGFERVLLASGGHEGVEMFRRHAAEIRIVLLDLTMPDLSGDDALAAMRAIRPNACIVLSSGYSAPDMRRVEGGADGFVGKPYRLADLSSGIRAALESVRA